MALVWAGSMIASQIVFIPGIVVGETLLYSAFWRNAAFLVLPIWAAAKLFNRPRELPIIPADKVEVEQKKALFSRPADLLLTLGLLGTIIFTAFRGFVILECSLDSCFSYIYQYEPYMKDSVGFPKVMMLVSMFYVLPLLTACVYGLYTPGCTWMLDWTLFLAGAVAQVNIQEPVLVQLKLQRIPRDEWRLVVTLNLLYAAVPVLLAVRCYLDQAFFMKNVPQEQASNGKKKS